MLDEEALSFWCHDIEAHEPCVEFDRRRAMGIASAKQRKVGVRRAELLAFWILQSKAESRYRD